MHADDTRRIGWQDHSAADDARLLRALDRRYRLRIHTLSSPAPWRWDNLLN